MAEVIDESWSEFMIVDLKFKTSQDFLLKPDQSKINWHCLEGFCEESMRMLNEEFNEYRKLFPLKVFIGGPPATGKTHFASQLAASYGIPHLKIAEMIEVAKNTNDDLGFEIQDEIEELKDKEVAAYEKSRKKKDPDLDRNKIQVRLPD